MPVAAVVVNDEELSPSNEPLESLLRGGGEAGDKGYNTEEVDGSLSGDRVLLLLLAVVVLEELSLFLVGVDVKFERFAVVMVSFGGGISLEAVVGSFSSAVAAVGAVVTFGSEMG